MFPRKWKSNFFLWIVQNEYMYDKFFDQKYKILPTSTGNYHVSRQIKAKHGILLSKIYLGTTHSELEYAKSAIYRSHSVCIKG